MNVIHKRKQHPLYRTEAVLEDSQMAGCPSWRQLLIYLCSSALYPGDKHQVSSIWALSPGQRADQHYQELKPRRASGQWK